MALQNVKLATKLWTSVLVLMAVLVGVIGWASMASKRAQTLAAEEAAAAEGKRDAAVRWAGLTEANVQRVLATAVSSDPVIDATFKASITETLAEIDKVQKSIEAMSLSDEDRALIKRIGEERRTVLESLGRLRGLKEVQNSMGIEQELTKTFNPRIKVYLDALRTFAQQQRDELDRVRDVSRQRSQTIVATSAVLLGLVILGSLVGAWVLIGSIRRPLETSVALARRISAGDLSAQVAERRGDEFGQLLGALHDMNDSLRRTVSDVRNSTESITTAASEIASGNQDLSSRTEATASSLQQTASSMEQITGTVKQSTDTARQASQLATQAAGSARQGGDVVNQVIANMAEIDQASRKIADIIGTIDGIAFQTNILALNAAVEAARAGEQGRGFAVVASEVRTLAQRSAQAAKEIKGLIGQSVEKVQNGSDLVERAGSTMTEIVASIQRVNDMMGEITAAASEQSDGIAQVNQAVARLDQMTQQNAALVEESAAAASSMNDQAQRLAQTVAVFRLQGGGAPGLGYTPS